MTDAAVAEALHRESFVIEGGHPLSGTVQAAGNKNAALPILAAALLSAEPVTLRNVPRIRDTEAMVELISFTGANAEWTGPNEVRIEAAEITDTDLDPDLCRRIRASFLLAGPLLARAGAVKIPPPGGDVIGRRRLDTHVKAFTCVSRRRRPITSPPGGGILTAPARASSGPASRKEARMRRQRSGSRSVSVISPARMVTSFVPVHAASAPV